MAMGGAFTSLGSDFSSVYTNPAGLGLYRKSEFLFTPGLSYSKTKSEYLGQHNEDFKYQFFLGSLGYVGTYNSNKDKGLVSASYAIGYNRLNNFNNTTYIRGENNQNSLVDHFWDNAEGKDPEVLDPFYERLAFDAYVIDTIPGSDFGYGYVVENLPVTQRKVIETKGGTGEWSFGFGLNFNNVLYFGMGLGIYQLNFHQTSTHTEYDERNINAFTNFHLTEELNVNGTGLNMNMGMIVRLLKIMRIGASLHLPTYYRIDETYNNSMYSEFDNGFIPTEVNGDIYAEGSFKYKLNTPLKLQAGASVQLGKMGIIAADVEYIDYSGMRLGERDEIADFSGSNNDIENVYRPVLNLKLGGEVRFDNLSVRLGGGYYPSPYSSGELNENASYTELTTGMGYRNSNFFFDLGFSALMHKEKYVLYYDNVSTLNQQKYRFLATMGFRF